MRRLHPHEERIAQVALFRTCSRRDVRRIAQAACPMDVPAREIVVREGQPGHDLYVIVSGTATVSRGGQHVATLGPGDYFGELAVLHSAPRTATVTADTEMEVLIVSSREFETVVADVPRLAHKLLVAMAARLQKADRGVGADPTAPTGPTYLLGARRPAIRSAASAPPAGAQG